MKIFTLFALIVLLASCKQNKQQRAEALVKQYLKNYLNDPYSYESVNFKPIDTVFWDYTYTADGHTLKSKIAFYANKISADGDTIRKWDSTSYIIKEVKNEVDAGILNRDSAIAYLKKLIAITPERIRRGRIMVHIDSIYAVHNDILTNEFNLKNKGYKGPVKRWLLIHTFRAKNKYGALQLQTEAFSIDSGIIKILADSVLNN